MHRIVPLVLVLLAWPRVGLALPIGLSSSVSQTGLLGLNPAFWRGLPEFAPPPQVPVSCSASSTSVSGNSGSSCSTPLFQTNAGASYGSLGASSIGYAIGTGFANATAQFQDVLTVLGLSGTGFIQYTFSGAMSIGTPQRCSYAPNCLNGFQFSHAGGAPLGIMTGIMVDPLFDYVSVLLPFTWGTPFSLSVLVRADSGQVNGDEFIPSDNSYVSIYAALTGISIFNSDQQQVTNYRILSAGGAPYGMAPVPEPTSLVLLGTGILASLWYRDRRGRSGEREADIADHTKSVQENVPLLKGRRA